MTAETALVTALNCRLNRKKTDPKNMVPLQTGVFGPYSGRC